uniref:Uncharacterized protein n=1 Tax=viral metagenome TaxID=1070528 RepID=A0A6M3KX10_9ZZZZ
MPKADPTITPDPETPSTVTINGVEYDPTEAQSLIDLGTKTRGLEKQWDTPIDKVWPAYGETTTKLKATETERDAARAELADFKAKQVAGTETTTDIKDAQEAARKLGIILNEDLDKQGYIKKEELPQLFQTFQQEQEAVREIMVKADGLEKEIDGTDGRPAFNKKVVLAYASAYNIPDLMAAYEDMNKPQLDVWKAEQVDNKKASGLRTLGAGGEKQPREVKVTDDNVRDLLKESLGGASE